MAHYIFVINRYVQIAETMRISEHCISCVTVTLFCIDRCHSLIIKPTKLARLVVVTQEQGAVVCQPKSGFRLDSAPYRLLASYSYLWS